MNPVCEYCGRTDWSSVNKYWIRCNVCGRLETKLGDRYCKLCRKEIGKYAKPNQTICLACKEANITYESQIPCKTPGCVNPLGKRAHPSGYCRQCLHEITTWEIENGHLWKYKAIQILKEPTASYVLLRELQKTYPKLTKNALFGWLIKHIREKTIKRTERGMYKSLTNGSKKQMTESPKSIKANPDKTDGPIKIQFLPDFSID